MVDGGARIDGFGMELAGSGLVTITTLDARAVAIAPRPHL
jgi:hypothetical protein